MLKSIKDSVSCFMVWLVLLSSSQEGIAQDPKVSPYSMFGDQTPMLDVNNHSQESKLTYCVILPDSSIGVIEIENGVFTLSDSKGGEIISEPMNPTALAMFTEPDPMANDMNEVSPYVYCFSSPINLTDPSGYSPIYSPSGKFLGTDDNGLQGKYYIIPEEFFKQSMSPTDAKAVAINPVWISDDVLNFVEIQFNALPMRPDYDGYLTFEEVTDWYRNNSGCPLYADLRKIDISRVSWPSDKTVGQSVPFNLLFEAFHNVNDGLVYGNISLILQPDNTVRASPDTYDFDRHIGSGLKTTLRNIETEIGGIYAGKGKKFNIHFYGSAPLKIK